MDTASKSIQPFKPHFIDSIDSEYPTSREALEEYLKEKSRPYTLEKGSILDTKCKEDAFSNALTSRIRNLLPPPPSPRRYGVNEERTEKYELGQKEDRPGKEMGKRSVRTFHVSFSPPENSVPLLPPVIPPHHPKSIAWHAISKNLDGRVARSLVSCHAFAFISQRTTAAAPDQGRLRRDRLADSLSLADVLIKLFSFSFFAAYPVFPLRSRFVQWRSRYRNRVFQE
ncbi:hypothetical protein Trydic_g9273 [Trypoxylus dichotomus]